MKFDLIIHMKDGEEYSFMDMSWKRLLFIVNEIRLRLVYLPLTFETHIKEYFDREKHEPLTLEEILQKKKIKKGDK